MATGSMWCWTVSHATSCRRTSESSWYEPGAPEKHLQLLNALPAFTELCGRLTALGVPQTLQHDDINDGNVFLRDNRYVFFDWGEACVSHLFHTLVVTLRILAYTYKLQPGGAEIARLRCADLEPWTQLTSRSAFVVAADLARHGTTRARLAPVGARHAADDSRRVR
jgi:hypothetical protein